MNRSEDLAPLLVPQPDGSVGFRQGVVESWDPLTAQNTVRVGGTLLTDLPTIASSTEVLLMQPGDVVGIQVVGNGATATMYIIGRIVRPGTAQAASVMSMFGATGALVAATETTSSGTFTDLATVGPSVTTTIFSTGRCLVLLSATLNPTVNDGAKMSVAVSGATTRAASDVSTIPYATASGTNDQVGVSAGNSNLLVGLNAGNNTFTAKYRSTFGASVSIGNRSIIVIPF